MRAIRLILAGFAILMYAESATSAGDNKGTTSLALSVAVTNRSDATETGDVATVLVITLKNDGAATVRLPIQNHGLPAGLTVTLFTHKGKEVPYGPATMGPGPPKEVVVIRTGESRVFSVDLSDFSLSVPSKVLTKVRWCFPDGTQTEWAEPRSMVVSGPNGEQPKLSEQDVQRLQKERDRIEAIRARRSEAKP